MSLRSVLTSAACAACVAASAGGGGGAMSASLSQAGASYVLAAVLPLLEAKVGSLPIPDLPFDQDGFSGGVTNIKCESLSVASSAVALGGGAAPIALSLGGIAVACTADWHFSLKSWPHKPSGSGSVDIAVSSTSAAVGVNASAVALHPQLQCGDVAVSVGDIGLTFHGSALDWILSLFKGSIEGAVKNSLEKDFAGSVKGFVDDDMNAELASLNLDLALAAPAPYNVSEARFGLVASPAVGAGFVGLSLQGDVVPVAAPDEPMPLAPPALPPFAPAAAGAHFVEALVSPYTLLSAAYTFFSAGLTQWAVPPADVPLGFNVTGAYKTIAPGFAEAFPSGASVALGVSVGAVPACAVSAAEGVSIGLPLVFAFLAQAANGSFEPAFALNLQASLALVLAVAPNPRTPGGDALVGRASSAGASVSLNFSAVGAVDVALLGLLANVTVELVLVPIFNALLAVGIPLPAVSGLALTNTSIAAADGFLALSADFTFSPTAPALAPAPAPAPAPAARTYSVVVSDKGAVPAMSIKKAVGQGFGPCTCIFNPAYFDHEIGPGLASDIIIVRASGCTPEFGGSSDHLLYAECGKDGVCQDLQPLAFNGSDSFGPGAEDPRVFVYDGAWYLYYYTPGVGQATVSLRKTQTPLVPSSWTMVAANLPWHRNGCVMIDPYKNGTHLVIWGETSAVGIGISSTLDFATYTTLSSTWMEPNGPNSTAPEVVLEAATPPVRLSTGDYLHIYAAGTPGW